MDLAALLTPERVARFWRHVHKTDGCWEWRGAHVRGYGVMRLGKHSAVRATRIMWFLTHGDDPRPLDVLHTCDHPPCVRDDHLFTGDGDANVADRNAKGRQVQGARHHSAKLNAQKVQEIRASYARGDGSHRDLAARYGVARRAIAMIVNRESWKEVA